MFKLSVQPPDNELTINLIPPITKLSLLDRIKMHFWNFILPPHVRLGIKVNKTSPYAVGASEDTANLQSAVNEEIKKGYDRP